jgi:uncharacterized protein YuzE
MKLYYNYDKDADILYFSSGKPSVRDVSEEVGNGVILRTNSSTKRVRGFTILNALRRKRSEFPVSLPFEATFKV